MKFAKENQHHQHGDMNETGIAPLCPFITHSAHANKVVYTTGVWVPYSLQQIEHQQCGIFTSDKNENTERALRRSLCFSLSEKTIMSYY